MMHRHVDRYINLHRALGKGFANHEKSLRKFAAFAADPGLAARFPGSPAAKGLPTASLKTFVTDRPGHDRRYAIDETKARAELGYAPARTFDQGFAETLRNLKDISPTAYLTVPKGWEELVNALEQDAELRERFFARISLFFFAAAGLSQSIWDRLDRVAEQHCGERIRMMAGLGMTEASPSCTFTTGPLSMAGYIGLPAPGCEVRLVPKEGKLEGRFRGPHIMPGYWRSPQQTAEVFDEQGYYCSGDALKLANPHAPQQGLMFDGRIAEDFKLSSGVFVSVGPLRNRAVLEGSPYVQDLVITAPDRECLGALVFPRLYECRRLAGLADDASDAQVLASAPVRQWFGDWLQRLNRDASGNASRLDRNLKNRFGSAAYAAEELIAELSSAMLGAELGLPVTHLDSHASYIEHWLKLLRQDDRAILTAAAKAEEASRLLLKLGGRISADDTDEASADAALAA